MLDLNDREWKAFKVKDIFLIEKCKCSSVSTLKPGDFPYVGATNRNNGIMSFVEKKDKWTTKGNCIVFICDGQGSVGYSIYKKEDFIGSTTLKVGRSEHLNRYTAQFLVSALDKNRPMYSYGYKRNENRLSNESIMLPTAKNGQPDYAFMEQYVREIENKLKKDYIDFINAELYIPPIPLVEKKWKEFFISDICYISSGRDIYDSEREEGEVPYITSTASNNGVKYYVSNTNETLEENAISVNRNGSVGYSFYHKYKALYSNDCRKLKLKQCRNEFVALFITNQITQQKDKYNYGYKMGTGRLKKQMIMLPITNDGSPDYNYMEQYIKAIMFDKYKKYLEYLNCLIP